MILESFFSEDNVLSDEIKICYIFEFQSNKNRAFCIFGGHLVYTLTLKLDVPITCVHRYETLRLIHLSKCILLAYISVMQAQRPATPPT